MHCTVALSVGSETYATHTKSMQLAELNQNWLNGHSLYNALLQGYRRGGRITSLGAFELRTWRDITDWNSLYLGRLSVTAWTAIPKSFCSRKRRRVRHMGVISTCDRAKVSTWLHWNCSTNTSVYQRNREIDTILRRSHAGLLTTAQYQHVVRSLWQ